MIEGGRLPGVLSMTLCARMRKISQQMIGILGILKICLMAREAIRGRARKTIVRMALYAFHRDVRAAQGKTGAAVIKIAKAAGQRPAGDRAAVALFAT